MLNTLVFEEFLMLSFFMVFLYIKLKLILVKNANQLNHDWIHSRSIVEFYYTPRIFNNKYKFLKSSNVLIRYTNKTTYRLFWEFRSKNEDHKPHFFKKSIFIPSNGVFPILFLRNCSDGTGWENFAWRVEMTRTVQRVTRKSIELSASFLCCYCILGFAVTSVLNK